MDRVGLVALSIVAATALLLAASYGALWLQPLLLDLPAGWIIAATSLMVSLGMWLHWRRRRC